jgi:hypothetical protein
MFSTARATDFSPQTRCLMTRRRDASGRAARGASRRSCKRLSTGRQFGTRHSEGAGDAVTMFSAFSASSCPPRAPGRKPPAAGLFEGSAAKVLTPGISISEGQSRVHHYCNHDGRGGKPRSCVRPPGDNRRQGGRGRGRPFYRSARSITAFVQSSRSAELVRTVQGCALCPMLLLPPTSKESSENKCIISCV